MTRRMPNFRSADGGPGDDEIGTLRVDPSHDPLDRWATRYVLTDGAPFPWHPLTGRVLAHLHYLSHEHVKDWPVQSLAEFLAVCVGRPLPAGLAADAERAALLLGRALSAGRRAYRDVQPSAITDMVPDRISRAVVSALSTLD